MIQAIIAFAILQSASPQAEAQSQPPLLREAISIDYKQMPFPRSMLPIASQYHLCLHPRGGNMRLGQLSFEDAMRARIGACRATREWAVASSHALFKDDASPLFQVDPQSKRPPREQVEAIFDSLDEQALLTAQHVDKMDREGAVPDGSRSEPKKN